MQSVLVIGGGGYVGSQLVPKLLSAGYKVLVFDTFWYGKSHFSAHPHLDLIQADMRDTNAVADAMKNQDVVIHLACISNDPSFDLNPMLGKSVNLDSFLPIVKIAKISSIHHFIYASSSSVYGIKDDERVTENLSLEPLTDYSRFKVACEDMLLNEVSDEFTTTIIRPATICGVSTRQRFDLVVNILAANAIENRIIKVFGGTQFRPNLHIEDMADAYLAILQSDKSVINKEIFNVGGKNLTVSEIAESVQRVIDSNIPIEFQETQDMRSYRVDSTKIFKTIGFTPKRGIDDAIADIKEAYVNKAFFNVLKNPNYINILRMKELNLG